MKLAADFGHATVDYAVALAQEVAARRLVLFHHAPGRADDDADAIVRVLASSSAVAVAAVEGLEIEI